MKLEWAPQKDLLELAIDRADAINDLWKFYATIVGASFVIAGTPVFSSGNWTELSGSVLPALFLLCAAANAYGIYQNHVKWKLLLQRAAVLAEGNNEQVDFVKKFVPNSITFVILWHVIIDVAIAFFIWYSVTKATSHLTAQL